MHAALENFSVSLGVAYLSLKLMLYREDRGECYSLNFVTEETLELEGGMKWEEHGLQRSDRNMYDLAGECAQRLKDLILG